MRAAHRAEARPDLALRALLAIGLLVSVVLIIGADGYGYHRDELYFLVSGRHLAWGYADQGPLTPLIARVMDTIAPGSLLVLRIPSALETGATVLITGALARELGGCRRAQLIAASCTAVGAFALSVGHILSTSTLDFLAWAALTWLVARAVRSEERWPWLVAGLVAGVALLNKPLIAFLLAALAVGLLIAGPRRVLLRRALWAGVAIALALWSPWLIWQTAHGWPELDVSSSIANGGSGSSQPRWAFLPFQILLVSPVLAPVWIAGLVALARRDTLSRYRFFSVAWVVLVVSFIVSGGKPYYIAGLFPILLAAGSIEVDGWLERGSRRTRRALLAIAIGVSGIVSVIIALPVLPAADAGPTVALNGDIGETIGWPDLVRSVAQVYRSAGGKPVIFTSNYGEAGAIDRYGPKLGLPAAYSGHNGFSYWGPPPNRPGPVVVIGIEADQLASDFTGCRLAARITNAAGIDNDERGQPIELCTGTRRPWSQIWRGLRHLN